MTSDAFAAYVRHLLDTDPGRLWGMYCVVTTQAESEYTRSLVRTPMDELPYEPHAGRVATVKEVDAFEAEARAHWSAAHGV